MFKLRFPTNRIQELAGRYAYATDTPIEKDVAPKALERGFLTRSEFLTICEWKTPRSKSRCARNPKERIEEATRLALSAHDESLRIGILRSLEGVEWPTASVILHFCAYDPYPILDFRALWSLGFEQPPSYSNALWQEYTDFSRKLAKRMNCSMRTLDRALWQYSKEKQSAR